MVKSLSYLLFAILLLFISCKREADFTQITLPQTPLLSQKVRWGGVNSLYAKLYGASESGAPVITLLRKGSLGQIKQKKKGWYFIETPEYEGWIRDRDMMEFESSWQAFLSISQEEGQ